MTDAYEDALRASLEQARAAHNEQTESLSEYTFLGQYGDDPGWDVRGFAPDPGLRFELTGQWEDPDGIGWTSESIINPSLIVRGDELHLFYRASPKKESLASRIGHAIWTDATGWQDDGLPAIRATLDNEILGVEDPKVYRIGDTYFMYYNGIYPRVDDGTAAASVSGEVGCDINVARSEDLRHWTKLGPVTDRGQSHQWAKGAVIPRDADGRAVPLDGEYLMYVSEGFGGALHVGRSVDGVSWTFTPDAYLDLTALEGSLHEVATAIVTGADVVLDFFYGDADGTWSAGQARYRTDDPLTQIAITTGGTLAWGGLVTWNGRWTFAQGWDARPGHRELELYTAARRDPNSNNPSDQGPMTKDSPA